MNSSWRLSEDETRRRMAACKRAAEAIAEEFCIAPTSEFDLPQPFRARWAELWQNYLILRGQIGDSRL